MPYNEDVGDLPGSKLYKTFKTNQAATFDNTATFNGAVTFTSTQTGGKPATVSGQGATATLTTAQSGSYVLFDRAAGIVYTLPTPSIGLNYTFLITTTITSNAAKIITDTGTTLLSGQMMTIATDNANALAAWVGNGSTHIAVSMNGTTTGGVKGAYLTFTCVSSTLWIVDGVTPATGTIATPFSTS